MAGRRTNLALLVLLAWAMATGGLAFAIGQGWGRWVVAAHGMGGLAILLLVPWKSVVVRRGLRRRRPGSWASIAFGVLVAIAVVSGTAHATGLWRGSGRLSAMQIHVAAALVSVPLGVWHVAARTVRPRGTDLSRRTLIRSGALLAGAAAAWALVEGVGAAVRLPGRFRRFTGSYESGSGRPDDMPVTQWLDDPVPSVAGPSWSLSVRSGGEEVARFSLAELDLMREPVTAVLDCTGGWFAEQTWEGVPVSRILTMAGHGSTGRSVRAVSVTGYDRRYPISDAPRLWVATRAAGRPLSAGHGFPARIVAPGRRGFWWVKWLASLEVDSTPWWWQPPFPLE